MDMQGSIDGVTWTKCIAGECYAHRWHRPAFLAGAPAPTKERDWSRWLPPKQCGPGLASVSVGQVIAIYWSTGLAAVVRVTGENVGAALASRGYGKPGPGWEYVIRAAHRAKAILVQDVGEPEPRDPAVLYGAAAPEEAREATGVPRCAECGYFNGVHRLSCGRSPLREPVPQPCVMCKGTGTAGFIRCPCTYPKRETAPQPYQEPVPTTCAKCGQAIGVGISHVEQCSKGPRERPAPLVETRPACSIEAKGHHCPHHRPKMIEPYVCAVSELDLLPDA